MRRLSLLCLVALVTCSFTGCLAIGNGSGTGPTVADEIRELKELCEEGEITHQQYQAGVNTLLYSQQQYQQ